MSEHGVFSGDPVTRWVTGDGADRDMVLVEDFSFTDPAGRVWPAPAGKTINGASIPEPLWSTVGSPYTGDYRRASVVHDVACDTLEVVRKEADVMFYHGCRAGGCNPGQAAILYAGVRIGAWASKHFSATSLAPSNLRFKALAAPVPEKLFLKSKLDNITQDIGQLDGSATLTDLDAIIEKHLHI